MKKGIVILAEDYCPAWEKIFFEEKPHSVGFHFRPADYPMEEYFARVGAPPLRRAAERLENAGIAVEHELHAAEWLLPRVLFAKEPSLFREEKGMRTPSLNYCFSDTRAAEIVSERAYLLARTLKQSGNKYYIWSDDAENGLCSCAVCRKLNGADQAMLFANAVLRGLRSYSSKAECSFLAYADALQVPSVPPAEGVFLEFAPIYRDFAVPIEKNIGKNGAYRKLLAQLGGVFDTKNTQILDYYLDISLQCGWKREKISEVTFCEDVLAADVAYYEKRGIGIIKTFAAFADFSYFQKYSDAPFRAFLRA